MLKHFEPQYNLTQYLTGHGAFNSYLKRFHLTNDDMCICRKKPEELIHLLFNCEAKLRQRSEYENQLGKIGSTLNRNKLNELIKSAEKFKLFHDFISSISRGRI